MSVVGVSSYFLWTQKGTTVLPLVRGSGFAVAFKQRAAFYRHHVLTAAHVSCPPRHKHLYGGSVAFKAIGERHVSTRLLQADASDPALFATGAPASSAAASPSPAPSRAAADAAGGGDGLTGRVVRSIDLEFRQEVLPNTDVATLRCTGENSDTLAATPAPSSSSSSSPAHGAAVSAVAPFELDLDGIEDGTELVYCGMEALEERANPNDDGLRLRPRRMEGVCKAALVSLDYGTVLIGSVDRDTSPEFAGAAAAGVVDRASPSPLPLSMCGGPVLRKSSGKCVGVIVARVLKSPPPRDPRAGSLYQDPFLDISENLSLHERWPLDVAFVPVGEFYHALRRTEL